MLVHFSVKNFAIIDSLDLPLGPGLTVLTGETGAGKSILIEALSLLLGKRAQTDVIRAGESEAIISAQFSFSPESLKNVNAYLDTQGIPLCEEGVLIVRRVLNRSGRHKQFLNGALSTVSQVRELAPHLVDFTSQTAQHALRRPRSQMNVLDSFAGLTMDRHTMLEKYDSVRLAKETCDRIKELKNADPRHADWLRYQLTEIENLAISPHEEEELDTERRKLMHVVELQSGVSRTNAFLTGGGDQDALSRVQCAALELRKLTDKDPQLGSDARLLEEATALIDDVSHNLRRHVQSLEQDPERLADIDERLDAIRSLFRKHGGNYDGLCDAERQMRLELEDYEESESKYAEAFAQLESSIAEAGTIADNLSAKRKSAARSLALAIEQELNDLGMSRASIEIQVLPLSGGENEHLAYGPAGDRRRLSETGSDQVEWSMAANPGERPGPLSKVASGGELSRVLLATKRVLLSNDTVGVSVFDEVDQGVGGAIGEVIAEKLQTIGQERQVLCISHLAQIAARADHHFVIEKNFADDRTVCTINRLNQDARVKELSRMVGGRQITSEATAHATNLLLKGQPHSPTPNTPQMEHGPNGQSQTLNSAKEIQVSS